MRLLLGDCREVMPTLADASVDSVVTDPPYELGFMGKAWDASGIAYDVSVWRECLRVLKPGGHLLAFGGSRTYHRLACAVEDAGFEIRDQIMWVYGSGFPKSLNVAAAVDEKRRPNNHHELLDDEARFCRWMRECSGLDADAVRAITGSDRFITGAVEIVNTATRDAPRYGRRAMVPTAESWARLRQHMRFTPPDWVDALVKEPPQPRSETPGEAWTKGAWRGTAGNNEWTGWGTALKPAHEPIVVARKPLIGTVAENVLAFGCGAINVDGCRVSADDGYTENAVTQGINTARTSYAPAASRRTFEPAQAGRWPANLIHDGSAEVVERFPVTSSPQPYERKTSNVGMFDGGWKQIPAGVTEVNYGDTGSAARFFQQCEWSDEEWIESNLSIAPAADNLLNLRNVADAIALNVAATWLAHAGMLLSVSHCRSINVTPSESRMLCESVITAIQNIGPKFLCEWRQEKLSNGSSLASVVATREPTGIMTITASHWKSDGSAEPVTFSITPSNMADGERACRFNYTAKADAEDRSEGAERNGHPTVKPTDLMRYLVRLVTRKGGVVLDPFMGSGSTGKAAALEQCEFIGIELNAEYLDIARARIAWLGLGEVQADVTPPKAEPPRGAQLALEFV